MKVYCQNCKYHLFPNIDGSSIYEYCLKTRNIKDTPVRQEKTIMTCEEARYNQNNDCKHYKRKWYKFWVKPVVRM